MLEDVSDRAELLPHAHHAIQITFLLKGSFAIRVAGQNHAGPVTAVGSDVPHTFSAHGAVAFLFIAPESMIGRQLRADLFADQSCMSMVSGPLAAALGDLRRCYESGATEQEVLSLGRRIVERLPAAEDPVLPDPRVTAMIDFARRNLEHEVSLPAAARFVNLSESRARHLFVENTNLPFKTFVLWLRLERALALYASGSSLTEAAHETGFADSSHFSRTFKRTFGLPAAGLRILHD